MLSAHDDAIRIQGGVPLRGRVHVGADPRSVESALALAVLSQGSSVLRGVSPCEQLSAALTAWGALGARCELVDEDEALHVEGVGLHGLTPPTGALNAGRSAHLLAQLAAVLSAQRFGTRVTVHPSCARQPVEHLVGVLRARGGQIGASAAPDDALAPPLAVAPLLPDEGLHPIDATLPYADSATKSALLLSGLYASGTTTLSEPYVSFDGLERMFVALQLPLRRIGSVVAFEPRGWDGKIPALGDVQMPCSQDVAAHFAVLAQWLPGSDIVLPGITVNPTQTAVLDVLRSWGAALAWVPTGDAAMREPTADLRIAPAPLRGGVVDAELLIRAGDCVPALALLGAVSKRGVRLCELAALGAYPDPMCGRLDPLFDAFGLAFERAAEELWIPPQTAPTAATRRVDARDDAGVALAACTLALATAGETVVEHAARALRAIHPRFVPAAQQLGARIEFA